MVNEYKNQKVKINEKLLIGVIKILKKEMKDIYQKIIDLYVYYQ